MPGAAAAASFLGRRWRLILIFKMLFRESGLGKKKIPHLFDLVEFPNFVLKHHTNHECSTNSISTPFWAVAIYS
jgi:hypothetical protein